MQTLSEIRELLAAAGLSPRKRFGQNFLIDLNLMRKLIATAAVGPGDRILEVGPGTGSLTEMLLESGARVASIEIDRGLCELLRTRLGERENFTLFEGDALERKSQVRADALAWLRADDPRAPARKLVANLPYQIATPLLINLLLEWRSEGEPLLERMVCTIQKELGERLRAAPRSEAYGPASVILQSLAEVEIVAGLPPQAFWPAPKVDSVMLYIRPLRAPQVASPPRFAEFVHAAFLQRRKTLRRLHRGGLAPAMGVFEQAGVSPDARPEELSPADWRRLFQCAQRPG